MGWDAALFVAARTPAPDPELAPDCELAEEEDDESDDESPRYAEPSPQQRADQMHVWWSDLDREFQTNFPPPPDFFGTEHATFGSEYYSRTLSDDELIITEVNSGTYVFRAADLRTQLANVTTDNAQNEKYLTDVVGLLRSSGASVTAIPVRDGWMVAGVNDRVQLAEAARRMNGLIVRRWQLAGVTVDDPATYTAAWAGLYLHTNTLIPGTAYDTLRFRVHGGTASTQLEVKLADSGNAFGAAAGVTVYGDKKFANVRDLASGRTRIVKEGDELQEYKVAMIDTDRVLLTYAGEIGRAHV